MPALSRRSKEKLKTLHPILSLIIYIAIDRTEVDFGVLETDRSTERQQGLFKSGKSKIDGIYKKSKHNYNPSQAFDFAAYIDGKLSWDPKYYYYLAGLFKAVAEELGVDIRWGGNFDMDNDIGEQSFNDLGHIEIIDKRFI